jgi:hypothetical protein
MSLKLSLAEAPDDQQDEEPNLNDEVDVEDEFRRRSENNHSDHHHNQPPNLA